MELSTYRVAVKKANTEDETKKVQFTDTDDLLAVEEPLEIRVVYGPSGNKQTRNVSVTMRTPGHDFELASGFLFTEGIIQHKDQVKDIYYQRSFPGIEENIVNVELADGMQLDATKLERNFYTTSSCGVCGKASIDAIRTESVYSFAPDTLAFSPDFILSLPDVLRKQQAVFENTGGLHASGLFSSSGELIWLKEDVGRHNALDKVAGSALGAGMFPLNTHVLLLSGRASFELIQKAAMMGIRMVCAVGAPSSLAVQLAEEQGITLIGFLRDHRFNCYTAPHRIMQ